MSEAAFIPLSVPNFSGKEKEYVNEAVVSEWVSTGGSKVGAFEQKIADFVGMPRGIACASGTAGLHLAMLCAGVRPGDEVLAPTLTFIAAVNPIRYCFAEPVFIGCDNSLCISPEALHRFCERECHLQGDKLIDNTTGAHVSAVSVVHVFGNLADMEQILAIAEQYHLVVIEDATEALGSKYTAGTFAGKFAGTLGDIGVYSFNGNKIMTTGSGGMVVSNHPEWAEHAAHLSTQAKASPSQYVHDEVGYNYRLTNLQAALGLAQVEQLDDFIAHKNTMYDYYAEQLAGISGVRLMGWREGTRPNKWFYALVIEREGVTAQQLIGYLAENKVQTRSIWNLIHQQAPYLQNRFFETEKAEWYQQHIVNLPCSTSLTCEQADRVVALIRDFFSNS